MDRSGSRTYWNHLLIPWTDRQTDRRQDGRASEESSGLRTKIESTAALRRGIKPSNHHGKSEVPGHMLLRMGRFHSSGLQPGSLVPRKEGGTGWGAGCAALM